MIKGKNTNEGKRVQQTLSTRSHGKTQWEKSREEYQKLLVNLLFYDIQLTHANAINKSTMNRYRKGLREQIRKIVR